MSIARHHAEWLSLVPVSGQFLSLPVLMEAFPQRLYAHDAEHARLLRLAYEEWDDSFQNRNTDPLFGFLSTNKISEGDTRDVGFAHLHESGFSFPSAVKSLKWPERRVSKCHRFGDSMAHKTGPICSMAH